MPFDALTTGAIVRELQSAVVEGRVQGIVMPGPLTIALEVYKPGTGRTHLVLSAHPENARAHLTSSTPTRDPQQHPPLLLLLRKYVRGGTLSAVSQPRLERVLQLSIDKRVDPRKHQEYHSEGDFMAGEDAWEEVPGAPPVRVTLAVELMGRLSNIVLIGEDGAIMDAVKRIPPSMNRYRSILPHQLYLPPPPQDKPDPFQASPNSLSLTLQRLLDDEPAAAAWKGLVAGLAGVSPALAREAVHRALGDAAVKAVAVAQLPEELTRVLGALHDLLGSAGDEAPTVAWRASSEGIETAVDFAPYRLTHLERGGARLGEYATTSEAVVAYFEARERLGGHTALRSQVRAEIGEMLAREERRLQSLQAQLDASGASEALRARGENILAYMHMLEPGATVLSVPEQGISVPIDPGLSPVENAQGYFREYRKARAAQAGLPERIDAARQAFDYVDGLLTSLELANSHDEILAVRAEAANARAAHRPVSEDAPQRKRRKLRAEKYPQPLRARTRGGAHLLVGRTSGQSDTATFRLAAPEDVWLHVRGAPGAHVILRAAGGFSQEDLEEAAAVAAGQSKLRAEQAVDVIYTERRNVRKVPNSPPGFVTYKHERVLRVRPGTPRGAAPATGDG